MSMEEIKKEAEKVEILKKSSEVDPVTEKAGFLPLLPLKNVVILPKTIIPVVVGREMSIKAVEFAVSKNSEILQLFPTKFNLHVYE